LAKSDHLSKRADIDLFALLHFGMPENGAFDGPPVDSKVACGISNVEKHAAKYCGI